MSWLDDLTPLDICQSKLLYSAVYVVLGLQSLTDVDEKTLVEMQRKNGYHPKQLVPVAKLVKIGRSVTRKLDKQEMLHKWRWMCRDNPDKVIARYVLQFKDLQKAVHALFNGMKFLCTEIDIEKALEVPESEYLRDRPGYINNHIKGVRVICGKDKTGRVINVFRCRAHDSGAQSRTDIRLYSILMCEMTQRLVQDESDGALFIYDLTAMTKKNADLSITRFIIRNMHNVFPMLNASATLHNAPIFYPLFFKAYRPLMNKQAASTIKFTSNLPDLLQHATIENLPESLGGTFKEYEWIPTRHEDDDPLKNSERKSLVKDERLKLMMELEKATIKWIKHPQASSPAHRQQILAQVYTNYWQLDGYTRHRTCFDRNGQVESFVPAVRHQSPSLHGMSSGAHSTSRYSESSSMTSLENNEPLLIPQEKKSLPTTPKKATHITAFARPQMPAEPLGHKP